MDDYIQKPTAVDVPVAMLIGTLGNSDEACQIYPPMFWPSANVFELPDPDSTVSAQFDGAQHFLEIEYADGTISRALVNKEAVSGTEISIFSVNLELDRQPLRASLHRSSTAHPELSFDDSTLLDTVEIGSPTEEFREAVKVGAGHVANGALSLSERCEPDYNCAERRQESRWRHAGENLHFSAPGNEVSDTVICSEDGALTELQLPIVDEDGNSATLVVHAQRVVTSSSAERATPINDVTPWIDSPDLSQALRVWIPYDENSSLSAGIWVNESPYSIDVLLGDEKIASTPIRIDLEVFDKQRIDLTEPHESPSFTTENSSMYFVMRDASMGPTSRIWWGDSNPAVLTLPVIDTSRNQMDTLYVNAWKKSCDLGWGIWWTLNSGQLADSDCTQAVYLEVSAEDNAHLEIGIMYETPASVDIVFEGRRWHEPQAKEVVGTMAYRIGYIP
jgi:hypothetical protein